MAMPAVIAVCFKLISFMDKAPMPVSKKIIGATLEEGNLNRSREKIIDNL